MPQVEMEDSETPDTSSPTVKQPWQGLLYVCVAVFFFSTSPIFVRWSAPFNAFEIAFWRLAIAALLVAVLGIITRQRLLLKRLVKNRLLALGSRHGFNIVNSTTVNTSM